MKDKINKILIGLLWLLATSLAATFWFNTQYGFNFFSLQHWQYLAYMQASGQPIKASFYISLALVILVSVFGLYILLQPLRRRIVLPIIDRSTPSPMPTPAQPTSNQPTQSIIMHEPETVSVPTPARDEPNTEPTLARPPRLNIQPPRNNLPTVPLQSTTRSEPKQDDGEIRNIFESAGYVVKGAPRIKNVQTSVIAIGGGEVLWLGATNVSDSDMQSAIKTLNGVFTDTLEDIEINIKAFIIGNTENGDNDIMHFANVNELRSYIAEHPNPPLDDDESENFDAYSAYIGTVIDYIRKI